MVQSNCDNQIKRSGAGRITYETGAALLVAMVTLLVIAFGAIYVTADQILAQHQMLSLELRRLERQNITEEMFESMALDLASTSEGTVWTRSIMNNSAPNNQLRAMREPIECPHPLQPPVAVLVYGFSRRAQVSCANGCWLNLYHIAIRRIGMRLIFGWAGQRRQCHPPSTLTAQVGLTRRREHYPTA